MEDSKPILCLTWEAPGFLQQSRNQTGAGRRRERALLSPRGCLDKPTVLLQHLSPSRAPRLAASRAVTLRALPRSPSHTPLPGRGAEML